MNNVKVFVLMAGMTALFGATGAYLGGQSGMLMAFVIAGAMNFFMYFNSSKMVLRMYRARVVTERSPRVTCPVSARVMKSCVMTNDL